MRLLKIRRKKSAEAQAALTSGDTPADWPTVTVKDTVGGGGEATVDWQEAAIVSAYLKQALEITIPAGDKRIVTLGGKQVKLGDTVRRPKSNAVLVVQHKVANG